MSFLSTTHFFVTEALTSIRRAGIMTVITVSTIGIALLMMGTFLLATLNVESFLARLQSEAMVTAFLIPSTSQDTVNKLKMQVTQMEEVNDIQVVTPEEAARELFINADDQKLLEVGMGDRGNPLPTTFRLKLRFSGDLEPHGIPPP